MTHFQRHQLLCTVLETGRNQPCWNRSKPILLKHVETCLVFFLIVIDEVLLMLICKIFFFLGCNNRDVVICDTRQKSVTNLVPPTISLSLSLPLSLTHTHTHTQHTPTHTHTHRDTLCCCLFLFVAAYLGLSIFHVVVSFITLQAKRVGRYQIQHTSMSKNLSVCLSVCLYT